MGREARALPRSRSAVLFLASIGSSYNIGIRHMLPVYPFLALAAAAVLARIARGRGDGGRRRGAASASSPRFRPSAREIARIHPHELSYFNPLAGGPERRPERSCRTRTWTGASI